MQLDKNKTEKLMKMCLELAKKGKGFVSPNPLVGCVIVKNNKTIGRGYHKFFGGPHAEIEAIKSVKNKRELKGSTLVINLEPCCHFGKTPPCVDAIIKAGIKRVICAMRDPNPLVAGKGIAIMQKNGINCEVGVLEKEAGDLNKFFIKWITKKIPYITIKAATTLDGKIATISGESKWITSPPARDFVHKLRSEYDAVLVGLNTIIKDNPRLTSHGKGRNPARLIVGDISKISVNSNVFNGETRTIFFSPVQPKNSVIRKLEMEGKIEIFYSSKKSGGNMNFRDIFKKIAQLNISSVLVEGGGETIWNVVSENLADDFFVFVAPKIFGGREAKTFVEGEGVGAPDRAIKLKFKEASFMGKDILIKGIFSGNVN